MSSARRRRWATLNFLPLVLGLVVGCSSSPPTPVKDLGAKKSEDDPLQQASEMVRLASDPAGYQRALETLNNHLTAEPAVLERLRPGPQDRPFLLRALGKVAGPGADKLAPTALERKLLVERLDLDDDEVREAEANRFSPLDAHYLDFCCELRDAARSLRINQPAKDRQERLGHAHQAFAWVVRQFRLRGQGPELQPPEFVLHQGEASAAERALIFLALLRQANLDGCMIAYPGKDGTVYRFAGVLLRDKTGGDVYLFDPRLGLPLPGPDGGVATLAQLRSREEFGKILKRLDLGAPFQYDVTPEQAEKAQVRLVFPLSSLSARMRYLEEVLATRDRVSLALRPARLLDRFQAAKVGPVGVWNERATPGKRAPMTPTRALRQSLPPKEGGVDKEGRHARQNFRLVPWFPIEQTLYEMKIPQTLGEQIGLGTVKYFVRQLFEMYIETPREQIIRGRFEEASKRLVRLDRALAEYEAAQMDEAEFRTKLDRMRQRVLTALREGGEQRAQVALLAQDQVFESLLLPPESQGERGKQNRGLLGVIVFRAAGESLRKRVSYLQGLCWQEKAARLQARQGPPEHGKGAAGQLAGDLAGAWQNAQASWEQCLIENPSSVGLMHGRIRHARELGRRRQVDAASALMDHQFRELRRALAARLLAARAQEGAGKEAAALKTLEEVVSDARTAEDDSELRAVRKELLEALQPSLRTVVDAALFGDLPADTSARRGTLHWMAYRARLEARRLDAK